MLSPSSACPRGGPAGFSGSTAPRSASRRATPDDEAALTADIVALATRYGRYGYRRITALLREAGWAVNRKRVERIWRREGLKVPAKQPKKGRLWLNDGSCIRLRPEHPNHVWSYDFVEDRTHDGRRYVAQLLPPISAHGGAMVVPDERRRHELDLSAGRLKPPADVDVVTSAQVDRVEPADRLKRLAADREVAAGHVLRDAIVEQHVRRPAWRPRDAVRPPRTVERRKLSPPAAATSGLRNGWTRYVSQCGSTRTSASVYATMSPVAAARPALRARLRPPCSMSSTRQNECCRAISPVRSREPSFTTMTSKSG